MLIGFIKLLWISLNDNTVSSTQQIEHKVFKQNYNCFAVENENELAELIRTDPDTTKIVQNAKKLMYRHTSINWAHLIDNN
jgi:hypothetical protein